MTGKSSETAIRVRAIEEKDEHAWRSLWDGYLTFYKQTLPEDVKTLTWNRICLSQDGYSAFVAEASDQRLIGFAICLLHPSTWTARPYCYLEDLFVAEEARGLGAGRALVEAVYGFAEALSCPRVYWVTEETNQTARALYDRVARFSGHVQYRKQGDWAWR